MFKVQLRSMDAHLQEDTKDGEAEKRVVDCLMAEGGDLQGPTLSSLDYPHRI